MAEGKRKKAYYKKWWVWAVGGIVFFVLIGAFGGDDETSSEATRIPSEEDSLAVPSYTLLDKVEDISTRSSDDDARYFGNILLEENVMHIPPDEFAVLAKIIAEHEGISHRAHFYQTMESYEANVGIIVPEENREAVEQLGGLDDGQRYLSYAEHHRLLYEGFIGTLEDGEFRMSPSATYYQLHHEADDDHLDGRQSEEDQEEISLQTETKAPTAQTLTSQPQTQQSPPQQQTQTEPEPELQIAASQQQPESEPVSSGEKWYVSAHHSSRYYYCEESGRWKGLSESYLRVYTSEAALVANYPNHTLHESCL